MTYNPFDIYTADYENWFKENSLLFKSEVLAIQQVLPAHKKGLEIGIGSGIFAEQLHIEFGIDPSENMLQRARERGLNVEHGYAEHLPYLDNSFDFTVFITSICFIDKPLQAFQEAYRVTKANGHVIVAFLDKESALGQSLMARQKDDKFYKTAHFYSVQEIIDLLAKNKFEVKEIYQTLTDISKNGIEKPTQGYGKGGFVVVKGQKV